MKKTIIINENAFKNIKKIMIREALSKAPSFGKYDDYTAPLSQLSKVANLHTDRYKDYQLEEAYNAWKDTGYDKNTNEYYIYITKFKHFMFGEGGLLAHISYTSERTTYKDREGNEKAVPLHRVILDKDWADQIINVKDWSYSISNSNNGAADKQCFYTTVLKIFQNPVIWNDFFFNPVFAQAKSMYDDIRKKITAAMKERKEDYEAIMPMQEFRQLNFFMFEVNQDTMKVEKGMNCKPELFYDPQFGTAEDSFEGDTEEDM